MRRIIAAAAEPSSVLCHPRIAASPRRRYCSPCGSSGHAQDAMMAVSGTMSSAGIAGGIFATSSPAAFSFRLVSSVKRGPSPFM